MCTETEKVVRSFELDLGGSRHRDLFEILRLAGLRPLGKSNTKTLLFQAHRDGNTYDVLAFRLKPEPVLSFPKSYWNPRGSELHELLDAFEFSERPQVIGPVSDSQHSAGQISMNRSTHERLLTVCEAVAERHGNAT